MTDVVIFHTDEQDNKTVCILSNNKTVLDDLIKFVKDDNFKMIKTKLNEKAYKAFISQHCEN